MGILKKILMTAGAFFVVLLDMFMASPTGAFITAIIIAWWIFM